MHTKVQLASTRVAVFAYGSIHTLVYVVVCIVVCILLLVI